MEDLKKALDSIRSYVAFNSTDWGGYEKDAWLYGIVCGWNDASYGEFSEKFGWSREDVELNIKLHKAYKQAMN